MEKSSDLGQEKILYIKFDLEQQEIVKSRRNLHSVDVEKTALYKQFKNRSNIVLCLIDEATY